ncbi:hypothetical protein, partial [Bradyrhizobium sp.]|uniref:hypothetical protein n=1 Tax=Bradyrhizobium sp. TaxID=376 RepID=UPI0025BE90E3
MNVRLGKKGAAPAGTAFQHPPWVGTLYLRSDAGAAISASHFGRLSDGQSLVRRTLPGSLAVSTELANRAVSSI